MGSMESVESKNMTTKTEEEATFNFPTLPYVCQRRFAEICDPQTLETFYSINQKTQNLCKRCHIIEKVDIDCDDSICKYTISCFCKENEFCKGVDNLFQLIKECKIRNSVSIRNRIGNERLDVNLLQKLPISIQSTKDLHLEFYNIHLDDLKMITSSIKFKYMSFLGGIRSNNVKEFIEYIKDLSKNEASFNFICHYNNAYYYSANFIQKFETLQSQNIITYFRTQFYYQKFPDNTTLIFSKKN